MAVRTHRAGHATTPSPRYALGPGAEKPIARLVALLLVGVAVAAVVLVKGYLTAPPSPEAQQLASFDPRAVFSDQTPHFLPTPVAVLPADTDAGPPAPAAAEDQQPADTSEQVKIANTGGLGAILRASPPKGAAVATLRDGTVLQVLEQQQLPDGSDWLHVKTADGTEGWVYARLVGPAG